MEQASKKFICIVDESKLVDGLGGSKGDCGVLIEHVSVNDKTRASTAVVAHFCA